MFYIFPCSWACTALCLQNLQRTLSCSVPSERFTRSSPCIGKSNIQEPTQFHLYPWRHICLTEDINILNFYLVQCSSNYDTLCGVERIGEIFGIPKRWTSLFQRAMHVADILSYCVVFGLTSSLRNRRKRGRGARTREKKRGGWGRFLSTSFTPATQASWLPLRNNSENS